MNRNKQLFVNLLSTLCGLIVNIGISFGLSKYIVSTIGEEAYGFVSLANNFVMYATILTTALNSMASRFITISIQRNELEKANKYFSSVLIANALIIVFLIIPTILLISYLEHFINISPELIMDVKLLFLFIILNFFISLIGGVFSIATYCTNKLYLSSIKTMESYIIKAVIIIGLFIALKPAVFYIGIATLISGIFIVLYNIKFTKELLPEIKVKKSNFSWKKIKQLLSSGIWNSITNLGNVLADGLDLIISNLAIDSSTMGIVALAKTPGNVLNTLISGISNVFQPQIIGFYSKNDTDGVVRETKLGMKITGIFSNIPFAYIIAFGFSFCYLWMPNVNVQLLYILCVLTFINVFCGGILTPMYNIFTITNKVKGNAILNLVSGFVSTLLVLILINTTNLGVYAIVGVSSLVGIIKGFIIVPIYVAKCLNLNWKTFFPTLFRYIFSTIILTIIFFVIKYFINVNNWFMLIISVLISGFLGILIDYLILFSKEDRIAFKKIVFQKLKGVKSHE